MPDKYFHKMGTLQVIVMAILVILVLIDFMVIMVIMVIAVWDEACIRQMIE